MKKQREIIWAPKAIKQFNDAIAYIRKDSVQNAVSVKERILSKISKLSDATTTYRIDPYKKNNDTRCAI